MSSHVNLRQYQQELFDKVLHRDSIIFLPTGAGKTIIAAALAAYMISQFPEKKVIFVVSRVPLVHQQAEVLQRVLEKDVETVAGHKKTVKSWSTFLTIDSPAMVIIDSLLHQWITESPNIIKQDTSLVIVDEVHNACGGPLKWLMDEIHRFRPGNFRTIPINNDKAFLGKRHPQILGLTASPISSFNDEKSLYTLLDITQCQIVCVREKIYDLQCCVPNPLTIFLEYRLTPDEEKFQIYLYKIAAMILRDPRVSCEPPLKRLLKCPVGTPNFINMCEQMKISSLKGNDISSSFFISGILTFLSSLSRALYMLDCASLKEAYETAMSNEVFEAVEKDSLLARVLFPYLEALSDLIQSFNNNSITDSMNSNNNNNNNNNKCISYPLSNPSSRLRFLLQILEWIAKRMKDNKVSVRGIVFCDTRATVCRVTKLLQSSKELNDFFSPREIIGKSKTFLDGEYFHMTEAEQSRRLREFNSGEVKLLVATSVVEEGLDISKCNFVIRYDSCLTLRSFIQSRGRARFPKAIFIVMEQIHQPIKVVSVVEKALKLQENLVDIIGAEREEEEEEESSNPWKQRPVWWVNRFVKRTGSKLSFSETHQASAKSWSCNLCLNIPTNIAEKKNNISNFNAMGSGNIVKARQAAYLQLCEKLVKAGYIDENEETGSVISKNSSPLLFLSSGLCICRSDSISVEEVQKKYAPNAVKVNSYDKRDWSPDCPTELLTMEVRRRRLPKSEVKATRNGNTMQVSVKVFRRISNGVVECEIFSRTGEYAVENAAFDALSYLGVVCLLGVPNNIA